MSNKKLVILGIIAAAMVVWAVAQSRISEMAFVQKESVGDTYLVQGLAPSDISRIELIRGEQKVTLLRQANGFAVVDKDNYPASTSRINDLLISCMDIKIDERISSDPANHAALEVTQEKAKSIVRFLDSQGELITGIVIGKRTEQGRGSYVRLLSADDVYVAEDTPRLRTSPLDYIDKSLIKVNRDEIARVTVTTPEDTYTLLPADANGVDVVLENMPEGRELDESNARQVFTALSQLSFSDVERPGGAGAEYNLTNTYVCELENSTVYTLQVGKKDNTNYVRCSADFLDKSAVRVSGDESQEQLEKNEAKLLARDAAEDFANKHKGWVYEIASYKAENLTRPLAELLEEPEQEQSDEEQAAKSEIENSQSEAETGEQAPVADPNSPD